MYDIVTIGDSTIDMFLLIDEATINCNVKTNECQLCFTYAEKIPISGAVQSIGGNAANVAVGAEKLGLRSTIVTEVGDDINGLLIADDLKNAGVDTKYVRICKGKETRYAVVLNYKSERTILSYHADRVYKLPKLPKTRLIYYSSLGKTFEKIQDGVIQYKKKHPTTLLACNPGSYQNNEGIKKTREILPFTDMLFVNKEEAQKLVQKQFEIPELLKELHKKGVKMSIVTDGARGSYVSEGSVIYAMPSFPIKAVSRTGAGDAYATGFIGATLKGHSITDAMRWGTANAGGVIQKFGGQTGLLTTTQIKSSLKKFSNLEPKQI